jgi:hypothetical protein
VPDQPTGTVKLLFTDLKGSTRPWQEHPDDALGPAALWRASTPRRALAQGRAQNLATRSACLTTAPYLPICARDLVRVAHTNAELASRA